MKALAGLTRQGFRVAPNEAIDLVHDFVAEQWTDLVARHVPERGTMDALVYVAFVRFARRRILEEGRVRRSLVPIELQPTSADVPPTFSPADREAVLEAMKSLDEGSRRVLESYFGAPRPSERWLAARLGVSRFRARAMLLDAIARLAARLERPEGIQPADWEAAKTVWLEGFTPDEAATVLARRPREVQAALSRVLLLFSRNLSAGARRARNQEEAP